MFLSFGKAGIAVEKLNLVYLLLDLGHDCLVGLVRVHVEALQPALEVAADGDHLGLVLLGHVLLEHVQLLAKGVRLRHRVHPGVAAANKGRNNLY